jgi:hypothetical protein
MNDPTHPMTMSTQLPLGGLGLSRKNDTSALQVRNSRMNAHRVFKTKLKSLIAKTPKAKTYVRKAAVATPVKPKA